MKRVITRALTFSATTTLYLSCADSSDLSWKVTNVRLLSDATLATHAANYWTMVVTGSDHSSAIGTYTNNSSGGTALTAGAPYEISVATGLGTAGELDQSNGQSLKMVATKSSTPADFTGQILIEVEAVS